MNNYFEQLASEHKGVKHSETEQHFFRSIDLFLNADSDNKANYPAVVMDNLSGRITGANVDAKTDTMSTGIMFLRKLANIDDAALIDEAHADMKAIAFAFGARMEADTLSCENESLKDIIEFNAASVTYKQYGPVFDNCYGVLLSFQMSNKAAWQHNPDDWDTE